MGHTLPSEIIDKIVSELDVVEIHKLRFTSIGKHLGKPSCDENLVAMITYILVHRNLALQLKDIEKITSSYFIIPRLNLRQRLDVVQFCTMCGCETCLLGRIDHKGLTLLKTVYLFRQRIKCEATIVPNPRLPSYDQKKLPAVICQRRL